MSRPPAFLATFLVFSFLAPALHQAAAITLLHEFAGLDNDGALPGAGLTLGGSTLFGTTQYGGNDGGTIFSLNTDGSGFRLLHEFAGPDADGKWPRSVLTLSGSTLFGTTARGNENEGGTLFSVKTNGSNFTVLHKFVGGNNNGYLPSAGLTLSGSTLFGTTQFGGDNNWGTVFSVNTDGSGFNLLHEFAGGADDGSAPVASLTLNASSLFGTTQFGGGNNRGTVFAVNTDGSGFRLLHEFAGGADDGSEPAAKLTLSGSTLFGTTQYGGDNDRGTVFSINTDAGGFNLLHEFAGGDNDGERPVAGLTQWGSTLFGTTERGGNIVACTVVESGCGTIFSVNTDGSAFGLLHEFAGPDGRRPFADLTRSGATLFGTTWQGGEYYEGTVFSIPIPQSGLPGDFNADATVDAADYVVWRKNDGTQEDYITWRSHFGQSSASSATGGWPSGANLAVPEPTSVVLCLIAMGMLWYSSFARPHPGLPRWKQVWKPDSSNN